MHVQRSVDCIHGEQRDTFPSTFTCNGLAEETCMKDHFSSCKVRVKH